MCFQRQWHGIYICYLCTVKSQTQSAHHMAADLPNPSQRPQMFHPDFKRDVFMIVLSVCAILITASGL